MSELFLRIPHRAAAVRRKAVTVDPDDVDVARAKRHSVTQYFFAGLYQRADDAAGDLFVAHIGVLLHGGFFRELSKELLDLLIANRFAAPFGVLIEAFPGFLAQALLFVQAVENRRPRQFQIGPSLRDVPEHVDARKIERRERSHRHAELFHGRVDSRGRHAFFGQRDRFAIEKRYLRRDGSSFWGNLTVAGVHGEDGAVEYFVAMVEDVEIRKRQEIELRHRAAHDPLTGLPNRSLLEDRLQQAIRVARRRKRELAVLLLDLDRFKLELKEHITHYLFEHTQRSPIVIPVVNIVSGGGKPPLQPKAKNGQAAASPAPEKTPEEIAAEQQRRFQEMRARLLTQDARID